MKTFLAIAIQLLTALYVHFLCLRLTEMLNAGILLKDLEYEAVKQIIIVAKTCERSEQINFNS